MICPRKAQRAVHGGPAEGKVRLTVRLGPVLLAALLQLVFRRFWVLAAGAESEDDCLNVEADVPPENGDQQCFSDDELGMVCGWDGSPQEAFCEKSATGLKVCARRRGGGRCKEGNNTPPTDKTTDKAPKKEL